MYLHDVINQNGRLKSIYRDGEYSVIDFNELHDVSEKDYIMHFLFVSHMMCCVCVCVWKSVMGDGENLELWEFAFSASLANSRTHGNLPYSNHVCCKTKQEILLRHMGIINIYMVIVMPEYMLHCTSSWFHHVVLVDWFSWYCLL